MYSRKYFKTHFYYGGALKSKGNMFLGRPPYSCCLASFFSSRLLQLIFASLLLLAIGYVGNSDYEDADLAALNTNQE